MKKVFRVMLTTVLVAFVPMVAIAQIEGLKNTTPEERAEMLTTKMQSALGLDEKATAAVAEINLKYAKENQTLLDSDDSKLEKLMSFRQNTEAKEAELEGVLTPEQFTRYEQIKSEMEDIMKQKLQEKYEASH